MKLRAAKQARKKAKRALPPGADRKGKMHGIPGRRLKEEISTRKEVEAMLQSNRVPAMFNHPAFLELFQDIMAPSPEQLTGATETRRGIPDPEALVADLRRRASAEPPNTSVVPPREIDAPAKTNDVPLVLASVKDAVEASTGDAGNSLLEAMHADLTGQASQLLEEDEPERSTAMAKGTAETGTLELNSFDGWRHAIHAFAQRGDLQRAREVAVEARDHYDLEWDSKVYASLVSACASPARPKEALALFDEMRFDGVQPNAESWAALMQAQVNARDLDGAFVSLERMEATGATPTAECYEQLFRGIGMVVPRGQCTDKALDLWFEAMYNGVHKSTPLFNRVMFCLCRGQSIERAMNLLDQMHFEKVAPDVTTFNILLRGTAFVPQWHPGRGLVTDEMLDRMQGLEVRPDADTFHALIESCASVGDVVNAKQYLEAMQEHGFQPDTETHLAMLKALAAAQALCPSYESRTWMTRSRGWPLVPDLGPASGRTATDKTSHLLYDLFDEEKGTKFKGFEDDPWFEEDEEFDAMEGEDEFDCMDDDEDPLWTDGHDEAEDTNGAGLVAPDDQVAQDLGVLSPQEEGGHALQVQDAQPAEVSLRGVNDAWRQFNDQERRRTLELIEKGDRKERNRLQRALQGLDLDLEDELTDSMRPRYRGEKFEPKMRGFGGAESLEEEWAKLVADVYASSREDGEVASDSMTELQAEIERLNLETFDGLNDLGGMDPWSEDLDDVEEEEWLEDSAPEEEDKDGQGGGEAAFQLPADWPEVGQEQCPPVLERSEMGAVRELVPSSALAAVSSLLPPEGGTDGGMSPLNTSSEIPHMTTQEYLDFDWEEAINSVGALDLFGPAYKELPRIQDKKAAVLAYSDMSPTRQLARSEENIQDANRILQQVTATGAPVPVELLDSVLAVYTKALREDDVEQFLAKYYEGMGNEPTLRTYRTLVEMHLRLKQTDKAMELKDEALQSQLQPDREIHGPLLQKLVRTDRLQEALALLDEAQQLGLTIRERHVRDLRMKLVKEGLAIDHPSIGPDPEQWRRNLSKNRRSKKRRDNRPAVRLNSQLKLR